MHGGRSGNGSPRRSPPSTPEARSPARADNRPKLRHRRSNAFLESADFHQFRSRYAEDNSLEEALFQDEWKASEYFKDLISYTDLRVAWSSMLKRLRELEDRCYVASSGEEAVTGDKLEKAFVTRKDCKAITRDIYEQVLSAQGLHLEKLEDRAETTMSHFKFHAANLEDIKKSIKALEHRLEDAKAEIASAREQDKEHHDAMMAVHEEHKEEVRHESAYFVALCDGLQKRAEAEEQARLDLEAEHKKLYDLIHDKGLHETFREICREVLADYVSWDAFRKEATRIHERAVEEATVPLAKKIEKLGMSIVHKIEDLRKHDAELKECLQEVSDRVTITDTKFTDKTSDIMESMKLFAQYDMVKVLENQLNERIHHNETDFMEFKIAATGTLDTHFNRLTDIRNMLDDHEHCLRHHAEEILNRSTKYDMVVCQQKVDQCALKDKVEADLEALNKTVTWQSVRLEDVVFKANFGEPPSPVRGMAEDGRASVQHSEMSDVEADKEQGKAGLASTHVSTHASGNSVTSRPGSKASVGTPEPGFLGQKSSLKFASNPETGSPRSRMMPYTPHHQDTELFAVLQSQLESLSHCVLGLAHQALRAPVLGLSREERLGRERELMFHLSNLVHWVTHRRAPNDWDPSRLTSLAIECMETENARRKSLHHAEHHHHADSHQSQELGGASVVSSSSSWSTTEFHSTESGGPGRSPRRATGEHSHKEKDHGHVRHPQIFGSSHTGWGVQPGQAREAVTSHGDKKKRMSLSPPTIVKASHRGASTGKYFTAGDAPAEAEVAKGDQNRKSTKLEAPMAVNRPSLLNKPEHMRELVQEASSRASHRASQSRGSINAPPTASSLLKRNPAAMKTPMSSIDPGGQESGDIEPELSMQPSSLPRLTARASASPSPGIDVVKGEANSA